MSMKKKALMAASYVMVAAMAIGGTVAYLTDTDSDTNVMTLGNVKIEQIEQQRVDNTKLGALTESDMEDFEQGQELLPYAGDFTYEAAVLPDGTSVNLFPKNAIDKFVSVKNTGKTATYVRTVFAVEDAENLGIHINLIDKANIDKEEDGEEAVREDVWKWDWLPELVNINGSNYSIAVVTYVYDGGVLAAGETTPVSLMQVALNKALTSEDLAVLGDEMDIKAVSQAVQAKGFNDAEAALNEAFGEITAKSHPWSTLIDDAATFKKTIASEGATAILMNDITVADEAEAAKNVITADATVDFDNYTFTLDNPDATRNTANWVGINVDGGKVHFTGKNGGITTAANPELYAAVVRNGADLTISGGTYIGGTSAVQVSEGSLTITAGFFKVQDANTTYTINCIDDNYTNGTAKVEIKGGTFVNFDPSNNAAEGSNTNFVADGYKVVEEEQANGDVWYTVVAE